MNARLLLGMALPAMVGFALGVATGSGSKNRPSSTEGEKKTAASGGSVTALSSGSVGSAVMLSRLAGHPGAGGFAKLRAYLTVVREADLEEFPELMERIQLEVDGGDLSHADYLIDLMVRRWVKEDPLGAMTAMLEGRPPTMRDRYWAIFPTLAEKHPEAAWQAFRDLEHCGRREELRRDFLPMVAAEHPDLIFGLMKDLNPLRERKLLARTLGMVAGQYPREAMAFAESLPVGALGSRSMIAFTAGGEHQISRHLARGADEATAIVARSWAGEDPRAALEWAQEQTGSRREAALLATVGEWGRNAPEEAMEYARATLDPSVQFQVLDIALQNTELSIERRVALVEAQGGALVDSGGFRKFTRAWLVEDAAATGEWLANHPGDAATDLMGDAVSRWANDDLQAAATGVSDVADPGLRELAAMIVASRIIRREPSDIQMSPVVSDAFERLSAERRPEPGRIID